MTTTPSTPVADEAQGSDAVRYRRRRTELDRAILGRVSVLQERSLADNSRAVGALARLRRAVGTPPGAVSEVWEETIGLVPESRLGRTDEPSAAEFAVHHAMTLFALHRQGRSRYAHVRDIGTGTALARLARRRGSEGESEGVRRRFDALLTAAHPAEGAHHLRGLVLLLRSEEIGLDYGHLAEDLSALWTPQRRNSVRLTWARQYRGARTQSPEQHGDSESTDTTTPTKDAS